jgi:hypothetical protein
MHFRVDGSSKALQNNASMKGLDVLSILRRAAVEHPQLSILPSVSVASNPFQCL